MRSKKSCKNCKKKSCKKKVCKKVGGAGKIPTKEIVEGVNAIGEISTAVAPLVKSFTGMLSSSNNQQQQYTTAPAAGGGSDNGDNGAPLILVQGSPSLSGGYKSRKSKKSKKSVKRKKSKKSIKRKKSKKSVKRKKSKKSKKK